MLLRNRTRALAAVSFSALAACSALVSLDGLTGQDAGVDAQVPIESGAPDADPPKDAGQAPRTDATTCDAGFCDGFDEGPLGARWSHTYAVGGDLSLATDGAASAPFAMRAVVRAASGTPSIAGLGRDLGTPSTLHCSFDFFVEASPDGGSFTFGDLFVLQMSVADAGVASYELRVAVDSAGLSVRDDIHYTNGGCDCPRSWPKGGAIPFGKWSTIDFTTDFSTFRLAANDVVTVASNLGPLRPSAVEMRVALQNFGDQTWVVRYDNVRCTP